VVGWFAGQSSGNNDSSKDSSSSSSSSDGRRKNWGGGGGVERADAARRPDWLLGGGACGAAFLLSCLCWTCAPSVRLNAAARSAGFRSAMRVGDGEFAVQVRTAVRYS